MCNKEFTTRRRDKIWCNKTCSKRYSEVKNRIEVNKRLHLKIEDNRYIYDIESNKWFITSLLTDESYRRFPNLKQLMNN